MKRAAMLLLFVLVISISTPAMAQGTDPSRELNFDNPHIHMFGTDEADTWMHANMTDPDSAGTISGGGASTLTFVQDPTMNGTWQVNATETIDVTFALSKSGNGDIDVTLQFGGNTINSTTLPHSGSDNYAVSFGHELTELTEGQGFTIQIDFDASDGLIFGQGNYDFTTGSDSSIEVPILAPPDDGSDDGDDSDDTPFPGLLLVLGAVMLSLVLVGRKRTSQ